MTTLIAGGRTFQKRAGGSTPGASSPSRALGRILGEVVALQRDRWILWLPIGMIAGAALWMLAPNDPPTWLGGALLVLGAAAAFTLAAWPSDRFFALRRVFAGAFGSRQWRPSRILAPFGLADPALELMASALDLIAAVGQTFGERPEAVRAVPQPPHGAFVLCVFALLWASLWRGALRWLAAPMLAASIAMYVSATARCRVRR